MSAMLQHWQIIIWGSALNWTLSFAETLSFTSQHAVLEAEANQIRASILDMAHCIRTFTEEVSEYSRKLVGIVQQIEGGEQIVEDGVGMAHTEHVRTDS